MSVRGLPKGQFSSLGGTADPAYGTVEYIDGTGTTGATVSLSSMAEDEITYVCYGFTALDYIFSLGRNNSTLETTTIDIGLNGNGAHSVVLNQTRPYPSTVGSHSTSLGINVGDTGGLAWCRARFRVSAGFQGLPVWAYRINGASASTFPITPNANPSVNPGGLCIVAAYKEWGDNATGVSGTGWAKGSSAGRSIQAYYILDTAEVETPPQVTLSSSDGNYWAGIVAYFR